MENTQTKKSNFKGLQKGIIACSSVTLAIVIITVVLAFILAFNPNFLNAAAGIIIAFGVIELLCDIALVILMALSIAFVGKESNINANAYRITFGILLGLFVLFYIIAFFASVVGILQLIDIVLILIFACIYNNKAK